MSGPADPSIENLVETYAALALALDGTEVRRWETGIAARNPADLPSTSFVVSWADSPSWYEDAVSRFERWTPKIVYRVGDIGRATDELWHAQTLSLLESRLLDPEEPFTLVPEETPQDRAEVAAFMAGIFFEGQQPERRRAIEQATARALRCRLYSVLEGGRRVAAVMLHRTPGALGLYNLCVVPWMRGRGLGASIVRQVQTDASRAGVPVVLQCRAELVRWYRRLGFRTVAELAVLVPPAA